MKCSYGCGQKGRFTFKSGNVGCAKHPGSCPAVRAKNAAKQLGNTHRKGMKGKSWNKGLTKATDPRLAQAARNIKAAKKSSVHARGFTKGSTHDTATRKRISAGMQGTGAGGYREGSGRGKKGWYNGVFCDSSWELAFVLWCEIKGYPVKRAKKKFAYRFQGRTRHYHPDFRARGAAGVWMYVEVKGYRTPQWDAKERQFPHKLILVDSKRMKETVLPTVWEVYGKNFVRMYE